MKKLVFTVGVMVLLAGLLAAPAVANGDSTPTTFYYGEPPVGWTFVDPTGVSWDLTRCDITISYTLDVSGYTPTYGSTFWTEVGLFDARLPWGTAAQGCMASGSPYAIVTNPNSQDIDDNFLLMAPYRYSAQTYDVDSSGNVVTQFGTNNNYGLWFDRDGVDSFQDDMWGMIDGATYNTSGIYEVVVTYYAVSDTLGTMFATINDVQQGFYTGPPYSDREPDIYPAGKSIQGDLTSLNVYANIGAGAANVSNLTVTGCPVTVVIDGCDTGVLDRVVDGSYLSEKIAECAAAAINHGQFVRCVSGLTNELKKEGYLTGEEKGKIVSCAARADIPAP